MLEPQIQSSSEPPAWDALTITMVVVGVVAIVISVITLCYAGLTGALGCLVFGVVMIVVGRRARYWP